jgi:hypothetical protein
MTYFRELLYSKLLISYEMSFPESQLCELLPGGSTRPRFFRISDQDLSSFPSRTFEGLRLESARPLQTADAEAKIR